MGAEIRKGRVMKAANPKFPTDNSQLFYDWLGNFWNILSKMVDMVGTTIIGIGGIIHADNHKVVTVKSILELVGNSLDDIH